MTATMDHSKNPRKACDFCYLRKIKCDAQKPRCSNCTTYDRECSYGTPSRQYKPRNRRSATKIDENTANLQNRVAHLETLLGRVSDESHSNGSQNEHESEVQDTHSVPVTTFALTSVSDDEVTDANSFTSGQLELPPKKRALPIIHAYIEKLNVSLPLFDATSLLRLVHETYNLDPKRRHPVSWAAINVVLALTHRQGFVENGSPKDAAEYFNKAQSVLSEVVLRETQLLNVQVLVGLVRLLEDSEDLKPALVLIATTMRLAHSIGLHNRAFSSQLDPELAKQRAYVFWIAYILDKDISLRARQPSIQLDDDIDLDLPSNYIEEFRLNNDARMLNSSVGAGIITTIDGTASMDFFATRIQLAVLEGGVYDYVFSTRAQKRTVEERACALQSVSSALARWKTSIPPEFRGREVLKQAPPETIRFFCMLQATSLMCTTCINQANAMNNQWVTSLRNYSTVGIVPSLPPEWEPLLEEARDVMILFEHSGYTNRWNWWIGGCSYLTSVVLLMANIICKPQQKICAQDKRLVDFGLQTIDKMVRETDSENLRVVQKTCTELQEQASIMINRWSSFPELPNMQLESGWADFRDSF